ncbi:MdtA/MuxA family multidrug efflux RND transporter periplasmic adaptor subunit [Pseudomonas sp. LPB0260]|uniref:MdtA/MuxA family multidrug efflux RND transporter periplasmic adaptor subunit n=1 Tax=Pseudomonas sp. LPB0260 TaxID=2614442 RepID=UPI0015C1EF9F|nr:MdtA/MuxA family multidrug efflux RND transporter periplasmic adaptor subunit [Pseudomonas sp. LPB0260]QLC72322.1 MdtA/MuxA family multidrug efflux RND transporter periplasmic adaptor subunit [Pseudomonas sp. LPB0260]QLC75099.1 MdtA/MuxA family multidrug efflux RND transporter periplasmic adaptor subunit [Pseudomonas sp. LPB0260]
MPETSATSRSPRHPLRWPIGLLLLAAILVLIWWFWPAKPEPRGAGHWRDGGPVPVRIAQVRRGDFPILLKALGTVTAYNRVEVRARVAGELLELRFDEGQRVKAGELLALIDPRPYEVALQQALGVQQQNQAQLRNAEIDLARYRGLYAEDSIAKQTLDTQQALVDQYRGILRSNQAAVAEARLNLDFTQVRAPIDGRLGLRQVDAGNLLGSNDALPLVVITQTQPISLLFTLPEAQLPAVLRQHRSGQALRVEAWDRSERVKLADGELDSLDNLIDTATGTLKLKARFANAEESLFPNQFVNVRLHVETREQVLLIPAAALQHGARGTFVYVVDEQDKVHVRAVVAGPSDGQLTLIEEGVEAGERLVLEGTDRLRDGSPVEVLEEQPAAAGGQGTAAARQDV